MGVNVVFMRPQEQRHAQVERFVGISDGALYIEDGPARDLGRRELNAAEADTRLPAHDGHGDGRVGLQLGGGMSGQSMSSAIWQPYSRRITRLPSGVVTMSAMDCARCSRDVRVRPVFAFMPIMALAPVRWFSRARHDSAVRMLDQADAVSACNYVLADSDLAGDLLIARLGVVAFVVDRTLDIDAASAASW